MASTAITSTRSIRTSLFALSGYAEANTPTNRITITSYRPYFLRGHYIVKIEPLPRHETQSRIDLSGELLPLLAELRARIHLYDAVSVTIEIVKALARDIGDHKALRELLTST